MLSRIPLPVKIVASLLLLGYLLLRVDVDSLLKTLSTSNLYLILLAVLISFASWFVNTYKWLILLRGSGTHVRFHKLLRLTFVGIFYNLAVPGQVGGEVVKSVSLTRMGIPTSTAAVSVTADRVTGLFALLALGIGGALFSPSVTGGHPEILPWLLGLVLILAAVTVLLVTGRGLAPVLVVGRVLHLPGSALSSRFGGFFTNFPVQRNFSALVIPVLLSFLFQLATVSVGLLLCEALGIQISFLALLWVVAVVSLLQSLPISLAGIGVREGAFVYLLHLQGVEAPAALALSLTIFAIQILMASVGGILQFGHIPRRG